MSFGSTPQVTFTPKGISNPLGFSVSGGGNVTQSPTLTGNIGNLQSTFGQAANAFGALGATVQPGFSQFRQAGLADIANTFAGQKSNLQDTLAQRRILGSSFANSQFSQLAATQAQTQADFEANSYLQELNASQQLIQQQYSEQTQAYSTAINQSNIESQTAAQLTATNNQIGAQIAEANAQLQAQSSAGTGKMIGTIAGGAIGFMLGGPAGALAGASIGGGAFGGSGGGGLNLSGMNSQPFGGFFSSSAPTGVLPGGAPLGMGGIGSA